MKRTAYILVGLAILLSILVALSAVASPIDRGVASGPRSMPLHTNPPGTKSASILFVGDMMFDRTVRSIAEKKGYASLFGEIRDTFRSYDLVVGNLEGPVTSKDSRSKGTVPGDSTNMIFTFSPDVPLALRDAGVGMVSLANNHILDFGAEGYVETASILDHAGILWFGDPYQIANNTRYHTISGINFAFVGYNQFLGPGFERIRDAIQEAEARADVVVVMAHWGDEYRTDISPHIALRARAFIEAGADLIVGAHPHVVQPHEQYQGKYVYYSLGNFIFDQFWEKAVRCGVMLGVDVHVEEGNISVFPKLWETEFTRDGKVVLGCAP